MIDKIMLASQISMCLAGVAVIVTTKHARHNYFAGLVASVWAGFLLATAVAGIVSWPEQLQGVTMLDVWLCAWLSGLAIWSGGNIFKVWRLVQSIP